MICGVPVDQLNVPQRVQSFGNLARAESDAFVEFDGGHISHRQQFDQVPRRGMSQNAEKVCEVRFVGSWGFSIHKTTSPDSAPRSVIPLNAECTYDH